MNENPRFHDVVAGALDDHGRAVGTPAGDLGDVLRRVDRRRARRRSTAVIGSTLAVAAGAAGIMLVADPAGAPAPGDGDPDGTATAVAASWGCSGLLTSDGIADYYVSCEPFPDVVQPSAPLVAPATSVSEGPVLSYPAVAPALPSTPPMTMAPTTTSTMPVTDVDYVVIAGDSVYSIADRFDVLPEDLAAINGWAEGINHPLQVGDAITVPTVPVTMPPLPTTSPSATTLPPAALPTVAPSVSTPAQAFRCTGPLGADLAYTYYLSCETVPWADVPPDLVVPTTVPVLLTAPPTLPPATTGPPVAGQLDCGAPTSVGPEPEQTYTVVAGDSLTAIAERYGISLCVLANYNVWPEGIEHPLFVGDIVKIPPGSRIP